MELLGAIGGSQGALDCQNSVLEALKRRWIDKGIGLEETMSRWIDEDKLFDAAGSL